MDECVSLVVKHAVHELLKIRDCLPLRISLVLGLVEEYLLRIAVLEIRESLAHIAQCVVRLCEQDHRIATKFVETALVSHLHLDDDDWAAVYWC